ncbi:energy transducer TonB [Larkinella rosea]|uniref:Energy transducer TonB n=1 Tax=Larkinella rosea TaxID=2025312 RepID=A0A3P1BM55_9BACT|nr:energy transducer TonB [Larkinella rosea]RRB02147.1 energy transducer TonB [Larkinella rosea]
MKHYAFLFVMLMISCCRSAHAQQATVKVEIQDSTSRANRPVFTVTELPPEFPGGMRRLDGYITKNLRYPEAARKTGLEGRVFVSFIVTEQGKIEDAHVLKNLDPELDAEALRLIKSMPTWTPAKQAGQPVACRYNLPVNFRINR